MRPWIPAIVVTVVAVLLGARLFSLERTVRRLERAVGAEEAAAKAERPEQPSRTGDGLASRVTAVERDVENLASRVALLEARQKLQTANGERDPEKTKDTVLSIMADETDRVLEKQLAWHKNNLLGMRKPGFEHFKVAANLTESQGQKLWAQLESEAQELVNLFRIPEVREDPALLIREANAILKATDERIRPMLDPAQMKMYLDGRAAERATVMPFLNAPSQ